MTERKDKKSNRLSAKRIALMAMFVALSYAVSWIEIPIVEPFKLDFGNVFILLIAFLLGPVEGVIVCVLKETLRMIGSSSGGVGELANMLVTCSFILFPAMLYRYNKGLRVVCTSLLAACAVATLTALITNRYITFPLYMGAELGVTMFAQLFGTIVCFNLFKTMAVSILTILLYKRLSNFFKKWEQ